MSSVLTDHLALPLLQKAVVQDTQGKAIIGAVPLPDLVPGTILVKTAAVALNPCDHKMGAALPSPGAIIGNDFAGTVVRVHPETRTDIRIGDMVCGMVHGSNPMDPSTGAFAQYVRAPADLVLRVPAGLKMEEAAVLGSGLTTNLISLWEGGLRLESTPETRAETPVPVLVYGASTSIGTMALQLLRLSGYKPIATCSPYNFELARSYGACAAFDYTEPDTPDKIRELTGGELEHALDCIGDSQSAVCCYASISRFGGRYASLNPLPEGLRTRRTVKSEVPVALEVFGKKVYLSPTYTRPARKEKREAAVSWFAVFQRMLDEGKIKPHPAQQLSPGFEAILDGVQLLKYGRVSGKKLVVPLA